MVSVVTVSPKFQVVIPKEVRQGIGIKSGQKLCVLRIGTEISFVPIEEDIKKLRGFAGKMDLSGVRDHSERF